MSETSLLLFDVGLILSATEPDVHKLKTGVRLLVEHSPLAQLEAISSAKLSWMMSLIISLMIRLSEVATKI